MEDIRKVIIIFAIGILFSVFVFSSIDAIYNTPDYNDFCDNYYYDIKESSDVNSINCTPIVVSTAAQRNCSESDGYIKYEYDENGCQSGYVCDTCSHEYNLARDKYNSVKFYISALLALIAIFIGIYLPAHKNSLNEWIGTGFMLGGVFSLLFGTVSSYSSLPTIARPLVILIELIIIIFISYKKTSNFKKNN
ncbi:MAG: hypothetical protein PHT94_03010 [Candidatus Nanoarchaeia archaeon]|nr:hypothetical protein [Candidatus Nanoarchaeia archaeon]